MKPYRSSSDKENCSPVSSNCVTWQGPNISCINLCKGDSVSDVVYKLATEICDFQNTANLDDLNISCLLDLCPNSTEPDMTLVGVLQLIIDGICCTQAQIQGAAYELRSASSVGYSTDGYIVLPTCLQYIDPTTGLLVTSLPINDYAYKTAVALCDLKAVVDNQALEISNLDTRVSAIERTPSYIPPTVTPNCTYGSVQAGVPTAMNTVLNQLDLQVCNLVTALGSNTALTTAASQQCNLLASQPSLSSIGNMSTLPGWNNTVSNFAQSMQNLWVTVCDIRSAVFDIKRQVGTVDCSKFILGFSATQNTGRTIITLNFNALSTIPAGLVNCNNLSTVIITDNVGHTYRTDTFNLTSAVAASGGVTFDISASGLNILMPYTITVIGCITDTYNTVVCSKTTVVTLAAPTTTTTTTAAVGYNWIPTVGTNDLSNATGNTNNYYNGKVFVAYTSKTTLQLVTTSYTTPGTQTPICVLGGTTPTMYFYTSDVYVLIKDSTITQSTTC
jgi:hypothetical protein